MRSRSLLGGALIIIAFCIGGGGFYASSLHRAVKIDPETLCPAEGAKTVTAILVDKTDPLTMAEKSRARELVTMARDGASSGDRIRLVVLRQNEARGDVVLDTIVDLCNPGSEANPLYQNPRQIAARYRNAFLSPFEEALASLDGKAPSSSSPIAQALQETLVPVQGSSPEQLRLIMISDLMQHSATVSAYTGALTEAQLRALIPPGALAPLKGADVRLVVLPRPRYKAQQNAAVEAWRRFFRAAVGRDPNIERL